MRKTILLSLLFVMFACSSDAQEKSAAESSFFTLKPLGNNVYAAIDKPKSSAGSNAGFVIGDDGVAV
ncbi:MAG TPA: hypothetical protein VGR55_11785, partial [Candidatus Acidoferrum sp.]|nr:hypothetical protein [Candidatus Acidoferrum sp.]